DRSHSGNLAAVSGGDDRVATRRSRVVPAAGATVRARCASETLVPSHGGRVGVGNDMNTSHLTFLWTPWSAALSNAVVLLAAVLCWLAWRRSGYARSQGLLELLRFGIVALMALILNQPEWVEEFRPAEKPGVLVLWDNSISMDTRDVITGPGSQTRPAS